MNIFKQLLYRLTRWWFWENTTRNIRLVRIRETGWFQVERHWSGGYWWYVPGTLSESAQISWYSFLGDFDPRPPEPDFEVIG